WSTSHAGSTVLASERARRWPRPSSFSEVVMHRSGCALLRSIVFTVATAALFSPLAWAQRRAELTLATTTSTQDTGLLDSLLPMFKRETGIEVKPIAVGTGAALDM